MHLQYLEINMFGYFLHKEITFVCNLYFQVFVPFTSAFDCLHLSYNLWKAHILVFFSIENLFYIPRSFAADILHSL